MPGIRVPSGPLLNQEDQQLVDVLKTLYPTVSGLVTAVARKLGFSVSYVMRVLQGKRKNVAIDAELALLFKIALERRGFRGLVILPKE
jgi:hypothetical protein